MPARLEFFYRRFLLGSVMQATTRRSQGGAASPLADPAVLRDLIAKAGLDPAPLLAAAGTEPIKEAQANRRGVERGAFGAPTFFVGDEIFFGNDRLDFVEEALRA